MDEPVILIGPLNTGKTTVGKRVAEKLGLPFASLDRYERENRERFGYDRETATAIREKEGLFAEYSYRRQFFADAVAHYLANHPRGVLELGGGHPIAPDAENQRKIDAALAPYRYVILIMPFVDVRESIQLLKTRQNPEYLNPDLNDILFQDDRFFKLAKHVVYTNNTTPEEMRDEIIEIVN